MILSPTTPARPARAGVPWAGAAPEYRARAPPPGPAGTRGAAGAPEAAAPRRGARLLLRDLRAALTISSSGLSMFID